MTLTGTVKRLVADKGFGFILGPDDVEYFFHQTGCLDRLEWETLQEGSSVTFTATEGPKGPRAEHVQRA